MLQFLKLLSARIRIRSIQTQIALAFSCLILFIISAVAFISYYVTGSVVERNSGQYVFQLVEQVNYNIQYYLDNVEVISQNIRANWDIQSYLKSTDSDEELESRIAQYLNAFVAPRTDIFNISIFSTDGRHIFNNPYVAINPAVTVEEQAWYKRPLEVDHLVISESRVQNVLLDEYRWVISCSKSIKNSHGENLGVLLIDLNFNLIENMVSQITLGRKGYVFILDKEGNIIYHPMQQLLYSNLKAEPIDLILGSPDGNIPYLEEGLKKQYTITTSPYSGWKVIGAVYIDDITDYRTMLQNFFIIIALVSLLIYIFFSTMISRQILHPIKELADAMHQSNDGWLDTEIDLGQKNEIGDLGNAFNLMKRQIKGLIHQNRLEHEQKQKSELKALQAQINPHFLYNTLDSIVWMAELKKYEQVTVMTSSLAKLFRISISKGEEFITVEKEIEHVINYLTIQKIRYADKFDYSVSVDANISRYLTLKLILQPIVENAIYHGIKHMAGSGMITITAEEENDCILFQIADDGIGMKEDTLKELLGGKKLFGEHPAGVGINNVDERIKLYFGSEYGLEIESELSEGTLVKIRIPVIRQRGDLPL